MWIAAGSAMNRKLFFGVLCGIVLMVILALLFVGPSAYDLDIRPDFQGAEQLELKDEAVSKYGQASQLYSKGEIEESLNILRDIRDYPPAESLYRKILEVHKPYVLVLEGDDDLTLWYRAMAHAINNDVETSVWKKLIDLMPANAEKKRVDWYIDAYDHKTKSINERESTSTSPP